MPEAMRTAIRHTLGVRLYRPPARAFFRLLYRVLTRIRIHGRENIPPRSAYLLTVNHLSYYDPPIPLCFWPYPPEALGAEETIDPTAVDSIEVVRELTGGAGADASLDATGIDEVRQNTVRSTRIWGRACFVGEGGTVSLMPTPDVIHRQLTLHGSWTFSTHTLKELANFTVDRGLPLSDLITQRFDLADAKEAFELFDTATTGKPVFAWD